MSTFQFWDAMTAALQPRWGYALWMLTAAVRIGFRAVILWPRSGTYVQSEPTQMDNYGTRGDYNPYTVATARARLDTETQKKGNRMLRKETPERDRRFFSQCYVVNRRADKAEIACYWSFT